MGVNWHLCVVEEIDYGMRTVCETGQIACALPSPQHPSTERRLLALVQKVFPEATLADLPAEAIERSRILLDEICGARHRIVQ